MAAVLGYWRFQAAQRTSEELFDRSLLSAALAISRDVAVSGGDAILPATRNLIGNASGGEVFYHVTGPRGIYVTGYAYPPVTQRETEVSYGTPRYFEAEYRAEPVRVLRMTERRSIGNVSGDATVTVWQRVEDRSAFVRQLAYRAAGLIGGLLATLSAVVWFGVRLGLRPLTDLEDAIAQRSPDDLSRIRRAIPQEAKGIVTTLNRLFGQVQESMNAHHVFISDAAHQLRNPAAAVQAMAVSVQDAKTEQERTERIAQLVKAARLSARTAEQLLSLDRLRSDQMDVRHEVLDLNELVESVCTDAGASALSRGLEFELLPCPAPVMVLADRVLLSEALKNLIDNAIKHGGDGLQKITVALNKSGANAQLCVMDDGIGLSPKNQEKAFSRFGQLQPSEGSGLGLAITKSIAEHHKGSLQIEPVDKGTRILFSLPISEQI